MGSGLTQLSGTFRPEITSPDFDFHVRMVKAKMKSMNDVLRAYGNFDVTNGLFSFRSKMWMCTMRSRIRTKGCCKKLYEGALNDVTDIRANVPRNEVATKVDISGSVKHPKMNTWDVVAGLIQNAFFKAILPSFEKDAKRI